MMMELPSDGDTTMADNLTEVCSEDTPVFCLWRTVPIAITLGVISIVTVIGNIFVMVAYSTDYRIRSTVGNTFILNLSICDFIIGAVSIPLNSVFHILGYWPFGKIPCQIWLVLDYTAASDAVLTMIFISLDRYWLLTKKLAYMTFQTHRRAALMNAVGWVVCTVLYTIIVFAWGPIAGVENVNYSEECDLESFENVYYVIFQLVVEFIIPLLIVIYLNAMVYMKIKQRLKGKFRNDVGTNKTTGNSFELNPSTKQLNHADFETTQSIAANESAEATTQPDLNGPLSNTASTDNINSVLDSGQSPIQLNLANRERERAKTNMKEGMELNRHRKAAITLFVLVSVFIVTWLPFNVLSLLTAFCEKCTSYVAQDIVNYVLWCKSTVNPLLYALLTVRFRQNFSRYLGLHLCMKRS